MFEKIPKSCQKVLKIVQKVLNRCYQVVKKIVTKFGNKCQKVSKSC
jgi:hypothetical protein